MNCQRNVNSILPTQLPQKFSYIVAILIHNHFESPNSRKLCVYFIHLILYQLLSWTLDNKLKKIQLYLFFRTQGISDIYHMRFEGRFILLHNL
jgi:hypothetical protein